MCVSGSCSVGYYRDVLAPEDANRSIVGDLLFGSDICAPCNELCAACTGPEIDRSVCSTCSLATSVDGQCVSECSSTRGKFITY